MFEALRRKDCIVAGDIGCYTLGVLQPFELAVMRVEHAEDGDDDDRRQQQILLDAETAEDAPILMHELDAGPRGRLESGHRHGDFIVAGLEQGRLRFVLDGEKLRGEFALIRMQGRGGDNWLLIKKKDEFAQRD